MHTLYDYTSEHEDEMSFYAGDELTILRRGDNTEKEWWWARDRKGVTGYVPCNLVGVSQKYCCYSYIYIKFHN